MKLTTYLLTALALGTLSTVAYLNLPKFGRAPQGERLERMKKSPNFRDGIFHNQHPTPQITTDKSMPRMMYDFLFEKRERNRPDQELPTVKTDLKNLSFEKDLIIWFGHSSYLIQLGGKRYLIDPVFESAAPVSFLNKAFKGTELYKPEDMPAIDYLVITHDHWDHLDHGTVMKLKSRIGKVICPLGVGEYFEYWGFANEQLVELDWNEQAELQEEQRVHCFPARHFSGRLLKRDRTLWASFLIETAQRNIYISGDGGYDTHFAKVAEQFEQIDVAILENGQYNEAWRYIHLMPDDLARVVEELQPHTVFAGHNSKYALAMHAWDEPLKNAQIIGSQNDQHLVMPLIGEVVYLDHEPRELAQWW